jgi:hypothetical protein
LTLVEGGLRVLDDHYAAFLHRSADADGESTWLAVF